MLHNKRYWDGKEFEGMGWLEKEDLPADTLKNVQTIENSLSVYLVDDEFHNENIILCGFAATRDNLNYVDFIVLDEELFNKLGITIETTPGNTIIEEVNYLHRNLTEISTNKLIAIIEASISDGSMKRKTENKLKKMFQDEIKKGTIKIEDLNIKIQSKLSR